MSTLTIRNLEPAIKDKLRMSAATHGRSMEEEVRTILRSVLSQPVAPATGMGSRIHARFATIGGIELDEPPRTSAPRAASFDNEAQAVQAMLAEDFSGRVLSFDLEAAVVYADLVAMRDRQGQPIDVADAQIAAICLAHGATLATRNTQHFEGLGLTLMNPWVV
ncbi:FitA-like ribbon-helix-helix domain-containing protein [Limnohabitans sp.]|uniref:FitA-like ribbon-helix-helix domain-containing protein n=1 Tax=Limnohabitans sp. TaxID=1907725 RepID=UPI00286F4EEF|nr:PIN domain-containing protein [Limnohabitans sp.]